MHYNRRSRLARGVATSALVAAAALLSAPAHAALTVFQTYLGNVGVSSDGWGSTTQSGTIQASAPAGSTVEAAFLYSSTFAFSNTTPAPQPGGTLNGQAVNYSTALGNNAPGNGLSLQAWRADVTSIVAPVINGGAGGVYNFSITETQSSQDGAALVVVYRNAALPVSTVGILDGFSASAGDSTMINFADPLNPAAAGFFAEMRLGIGFSCCSQTSTVTVNGTDITRNAGNNDDSADGFPSNGNLITVGGFDDPFSPLLPTYAGDKERYNLVPFITAGDTSISVNTRNPSNDDNIFLALFHVLGRAGVNEPPPPPPPPVGVMEPATLGLLGTGLFGLAMARRRRR